MRGALELLEGGFADATAVFCGRDFELRWTRPGRLPRSHRGPEALARHFDDLVRDWDDVRVTCDRVTAAGDDRVLAYYSVRPAAAGSRAAETRHRALVRVHAGRLRRWEAFQEIE